MNTWTFRGRSTSAHTMHSYYSTWSIWTCFPCSCSRSASQIEKRSAVCAAPTVWLTFSSTFWRVTFVFRPLKHNNSKQEYLIHFFVFFLAGYVPGEAVILRVEIQNKSGERVTSLIASIMRIVTFHARNRSKREHAYFGQVQSLKSIPPNSVDVWNARIPISPVCTRLVKKYQSILKSTKNTFFFLKVV